MESTGRKAAVVEEYPERPRALCGSTQGQLSQCLLLWRMPGPCPMGEWRHRGRNEPEICSRLPADRHGPCQRQLSGTASKQGRAGKNQEGDCASLPQTAPAGGGQCPEEGLRLRRENGAGRNDIHSRRFRRLSSRRGTSTSGSATFWCATPCTSSPSLSTACSCTYSS